MDATEFEIDKGELQKIVAQRGACLRVNFGEVWVTQSGDSADYLLRTGESLVLNGEGMALAHARKPTVLELHRPEPLASGAPRKRDASHALAAATAMLWRMFA